MHDVRTGAAPALSVVLLTWDRFASIRATVRHLTAQTIASEIELIICAPDEDRVAVDADAVAALHSVRVIEYDDAEGTGPVRARAIRAAAAHVVAFAEDHCYPFEDWAAALLAAHAEPHAAVGPAVYNANPESLTSWADLNIGYGRWLAPGRRRTVDLLPGHNTSYKRDVLLAYGPELDRLMEAETVLLWDLRRHGHTLLFEPAARVQHINFTRFRVFLDVMWHLGRVFAATRAERWSMSRRVAYAAAAPAIPFIRLGHVLQSAVQNRYSPLRLFATSPILIAGLAVDCLAQAIGALVGAGPSVTRLAAYEFHRDEINRTGRLPRRDAHHAGSDFAR